MPTLVGRSLVGQANSYFEAVYSMGYIIGPAVAGILAATIGPGPTLAIDAVSYVVSAVGLVLVRRELKAAVDRPRQRLVTEIREGIDYVITSPVLRSAILFWSTISIMIAPLVLALTVHVTRDLGYTPFVLGLILASYGVGTVVGSLVSASRIGRGRVAEVLLGGGFVVGLSLVVVSITVAIPVLLAVAVVAGIAQSMVLVMYITVRTAYSPDELLGRIGSTARTVSLGLQPIGLLLGGALIDATSGSTTIAAIGLGIALVSLLFIPVRALRSATLAPR
jgi:predicted MFS family arabinose efflux permease